VAAAHAGEVFPTDVRTTAHGISAMVGKAGALLAGILFHYINNVHKFWWCFATCAAGLVVSIVFVPDLTGLDLWRGTDAGTS
jgi:dipeptide/tripeptide permease